MNVKYGIVMSDQLTFSWFVDKCKFGHQARGPRRLSEIWSINLKNQRSLKEVKNIVFLECYYKLVITFSVGFSLKMVIILTIYEEFILSIP
jgi:hypothetical protein